MSLFEELKRRNVIRVGLAYMVTAWLLIQVAETVFPLFGFDDTPARMVVITLAIGLLPVLILAWVFELTPDGIKQEKDVDRSQSLTPDTGRKLNKAIIAVLVIALVYFAIDKFILDPRREAAMQQEMTAKLASANKALRRSSDAKSIAVLPFSNMSGDPANEPFTLGIHDDLLTHLSRIKSLRTISRTSVLQYRDTTKTVPQIAMELGAQHILEGGIQRTGNRVRINMQLIDANTDEHLWAEKYDRELTADNLFDVQGEIATEVARSLRATLLPEEQSALKTKPTHSMEAYDLYLLGRHHWNQRTAESIEKARGFFTQAIEIDPQYVLAYSGLADSYALLARYGNMTGEEAFPKAREAVDKAMALDDSLSEVWASRGLLLWSLGKNPEAAKALVRAIGLDQRNFSAWLWYANTLLAMRRFDEHIKALETAFSLEPMSPPVNNNLIIAYRNRGDFERAHQHLDRLLELKDRERFRLEKVNAYYRSGKPATAVVEARKILSKDPGNIQAMTFLVDAYIVFDDLDTADIWVERMSSLDPGRPWGREVFEARKDFAGAINYIDEIGQQPGFSDFAWYWYLKFRYANLAGEIESAKSYFNEYSSIAKGFDEINPSDLWQSDELRIAEFLINHGNQKKLGEKMLNEALSSLQRMNAVGHDHPGTYYGLANAWALKGDHDKSLLALEKAVMNGFLDKLSLSTEPALKPLRQDPRFIEIVDRMNQRIEEQKQLLANIQLAPYQELVMRDPVEVPRETLEKYAGYYSDGEAVLRFRVDENGRFMAKSPRIPEMRALASTQDTFYAEQAPAYTMQFVMDENGEVSYASAKSGQGSQRFKRVDAPPPAITLDSSTLKRYEGTYSVQGVREASDGEAETDIWVVKINVDDENRAFIEYENQPPMEILPYTETKFFMPGFVHRFEFQINPINGSVESLVQQRDGLDIEYKPE